jgi:deoxyribodipyrimidine photolyase
MQKINIFWFRRDLRLEDNTALYYALREEKPVLPIFILIVKFWMTLTSLLTPEWALSIGV